MTGTHGVSVVAIVASAGTFPEDVDGQRVAVTGDEPLPDPLGLARLLAADFGRAVDVDVVFEPVINASAPDPSD